jgi:glycosyltransferase involved in cell wall biosynthesis
MKRNCIHKRSALPNESWRISDRNKDQQCLRCCGLRVDPLSMAAPEGIKLLMEKPKSVMHLAYYSSNISGNFIASLASLHDFLKAKGVRCILGLPKNNKIRDWHSSLCSQGCHVIDLPNRGTSKLSCIKPIHEYILQYRPDIVHTHFTQYDIPAVVASWLIPRRARPKIVWHRHSDIGERIVGAKRIRCLVKHRVLGYHVTHLAVSESIRNLLYAEGLPCSKIHVIENGIDFSRVHITVEARQRIRAEWNIPSEDCVFLMFGWQPIVKGVDVAVRAFLSLRSQHRRCWLVIAGEEKTKRLLSERFPKEMAGVVVTPTRPDASELYSGADVFISASRTEGFSYAAVEAAYCRPVIASDISGVEHLHDIAGIQFFKSGDSEALASIMADYLDAVARGKQPEAPDPAAVYHRYAVEHWSRRCLEFYKRLIVPRI